MCGIVYAHAFDGTPVNNAVMQQFDSQRHRGLEGFGLFDGQEKNIVKTSKEDGILKWLVKYDSNLILFHHRNPTSTINVKRAAHPFSTKDYFGDDQYIMVHNGYITNAKTLFATHQEMGITYQSKLIDDTFNDSEALAWDLALTLEGKQDSLTARGAIAFICLKLHKGALEKMYFGRNSNPLKLFRHKEGIALSSEGEGELIEDNTLYTYNYKLNRLTNRAFNIPQYADYNYTPSRSGLPYMSDWRDDYTGPRGNWLPQHLRSRYDKFLNDGFDELVDYDTDGNPLFASDFEDYEEDPKSGLYVPRGNLDDEDYEELEGYTPDRGEVESRALEYLFTAQGNFETAYWAVELDYDAVEAADDSMDTIKERRLLEKVLDFISKDPEYVDIKSVSSTWEALCEQQKLTV